MGQLISLRRTFTGEGGTGGTDLDTTGTAKGIEPLFKKLFVDDSNYRLISSSPKVFSAIHEDDFTDNFYISEAELNAYISGFMESINQNVDDAITKSNESGKQDDLNDSALDDADIKLSLYRSFKSLYDKWISKSNNKNSESTSGSTSGYFYNNYGETKDERMLYDHFSFVNRCGSDIGSKAVIDVAFLSNLASKQNGQGPTQSLYESINQLLGNNNFDFWPLPSFITFSDKDDTILTDMFRAFDGPLDNVQSNPNFVCMFIGGSSRSLDIPVSYCGNEGTKFEYTNDSFDVNDPTSYPEDFKTGGDITAFLVRYGQEAQNHFYNLQLDQAEFKETQYSLMVIDALVNPKTGSQPSQAGKGNNLYDTYLTRSYTCEVSSLGNMMIQPNLFFKLENVPLFRGTYLITGVKHEIKPHNAKTIFTGVRQPIVTVPLVTDAISLLDLSLIDVEETATGGGSNNGGGGATILPANQVFIDDTVYADNSDKQCPNIEGITDGGVGDAYVNGKRTKIRLCKVYGGLTNVIMAENLFNLITDARAQGLDMGINSSFRTMEKQISIAEGYKCYRTGEFVAGNCTTQTARPGYSRHQAGTAIDFSCNGNTIFYGHDTAWAEKNGASSNPSAYKCFRWLQDNSAKYSYINLPSEAWHYSIDGK